MKSAGKARNNGLYRHIRTSKEIIRNLLNDSINNSLFLCQSDPIPQNRLFTNTSFLCRIFSNTV